MFVVGHSLSDELTMKMCYMSIVEYYPTVRMKLASIRVELETIIPREVMQTQTVKNEIFSLGM